jgi:hypothetical protein
MPKNKTLKCVQNVLISISLPREASLTAVMAVSRRTEHHGTPVRSVRAQRAQRCRLRTQALPPANVRVSLPQNARHIRVLCVGRRRRLIVARRAVLLVPVGNIELLQRGLHAQLVLAERDVRLARLLELIFWRLAGEKRRK